jgi:TPR repeat protein
MTPEQAERIYDDEDPVRARELLPPAAEGGNPAAQYYMGHLCDEESPKNPEEAVSWYRKSSIAGFLPGTHYLASFMCHGYGTPQNIDEALRLFRLAAEAGLDSSQLKLGQHLLSEPSSRNEALRWLREAATQGHQAAIELLANANRNTDA